MTRPFFALGSYKARVNIPVSGNFSLAGASSNSMAASISGTASMVPRGASIARAAFSFVGTAGITPAIIDATSLAWTVGSITLTEGQTGQAAGQFNVAATGPSGYTAGGVYSFGYEGTTPPTGLTLDEDGNPLDVGTATAANTSGVKFSYYEPGATTTLTLHSTSAGTFPYMATIYPLEGTVPSGQILLSPDDSTFRSSVLSTWPDGSAQVMVGAGRKAVSASSTTPIKLRPGLASGANLTTTDLVAVVSTVAVNFGTPLSLTLTNSNHDRIWWQNPEVICARYRLPITNKGSMEAVIDVHAFAGGRAFVEVVIENGQVNANLATVTGPSTQPYTNATVSVNGTTIATVSSPTASMAAPTRRLPATYAGGHEAFRAWYCSAKVVSGIVTALTTAQQQAEMFGVEVTHDTNSLRAHPWFFEPAEETTENLTTKYSQSYDTYQPWSTCRLRVPGMDDSGDDEQIALFTEDQADYALFGNKQARRAVIATGQACLSLNFNWRHTDGSIPTTLQLSGKGVSPLGTWPGTGTEPTYGGPSTGDGSHIPAVALVPFLCRPSPCFIEIAQKELCWNYTNYVGGINVGLNGRHRYDQIRSRAWRVRNYAFAAYLTPDADVTRKAQYRTLLASQAQDITEFLNISGNQLLAIWDLASSSLSDASGSRSGFQTSFWMMQFIVFTYSHISMAKVLRGSDAATWDAMVDAYTQVTPKFINDATSYEFRAIPYQPTLGTVAGDTITFASTNWQTIAKNELSGSEWQSPGPWLDFQPDDTAWSTCTPWTNVSVGGNYSAIFWNALCAAVERDVVGASAAWDRVVTNGGVNNIAAWRVGFRTMPRWNRWPRNK